jgi:hypothetical protein
MRCIVTFTGLILIVRIFLDFCRENAKYAAMITELNRIRRVLRMATKPTAWRVIIRHIWFGLKVIFSSAGDVPAAGPVVGMWHFLRGCHRSLGEDPPYGT